MSGLPSCCQCGKTAILSSDTGEHLCVDCYERVLRLDQIRLANLVDERNYYAERVENAIGVPMPRYSRPQLVPSYASTTINIDRSTIGVVNMGSVSRLDVDMTALGASGAMNLASEIKEFAEAVLGSNELSSEAKTEVVETLSFLAQEAAEPAAKRRRTLLGAAVGRITSLISVAANLATLWGHLASLFSGGLGS